MLRLRHGEREDSAILTPEVCGVCAAQLEALNTRRAAEHGLVDESDGGPLVYLVNKEWFTEFESFVLSTALDVSPPGRIDNKVRLPASPGFFSLATMAGRSVADQCTCVCVY
jgi:hypothetical protein